MFPASEPSQPTPPAHGHHHSHAHPHPHAPPRRAAPSRFRSLIALSGLQRLLLALPPVAALWLLTFWAMGWFA